MPRGNETVTILHKADGPVDAYNIPTSTVVEQEVRGCLIAWSGTTLTETAFRDLKELDGVIYFPKGTVLEIGDTFRVRGDLFEMQGLPTLWEPYAGASVRTRPYVSIKRMVG